MVHNFTSRARAIQLQRSDVGSALLWDLLWTNDSMADENGRHTIQLQPYDYRWFREREPEGRIEVRGSR